MRTGQELRNLPYHSSPGWRASIAALAVVLSFLLAGCNTAGVSTDFGWNFWDRGGLRANVVGMKTDSERKTVRLGAGETLIVHYDIEVARGELVLDVGRPVLLSHGEPDLWYESFDSDSQGTIEVPVEESGAYEIAVRLNRFGGRYDVTWDTE